jgi:aminopeptidase N
VDPEDGEAYVYSESFLDYAQRIFACFDQPDLKAPFVVSATAPEGWIVLANSPGEQVEPGRWRFEATPPMATYLFALAAGPYVSETADHRGTPIGIWCRRSMARYLDADDAIDLLKRGIDYYERLFGTPMPYPKYDQIFLPEMYGAMENPGLVTFGDNFLFRSAVTDDRLRQRAEVTLHELAHMWFGDLVTMRWWDDIWLNESFATYISYRALVEATRHHEAWTTFALSDKEWGYRQDALPTTHPISPDVPDAGAALLNMDGISYSKGAGVIKQLVAWVGDEPFLSGLQAYIRKHALGNSTLADLMAQLEAASGRALGPWSDEWLRTAGIATLRPLVDIGPDGRYRSVVIEQIAPPEHPTLRSHRIAVGLFDQDGVRLVRRSRLELDVQGPRTTVQGLAGEPVADVLLLNDDDLAWAKTRLDERSLAAIREGAIGRIEESLARAILWMAVLDMTRDADLPVGDAFAIFLEGLGDTREIGTTRLLVPAIFEAIDRHGRPELRQGRLERFAARAEELLAAADPGSDAQLAFARAVIDTTCTETHVTRLRAWLAGRGVPRGVEIGLELRWAIIARLATLGHFDAGEIDAECQIDLTIAGAEAGAVARASLPAAEAKEAAWRALVAPDDTALGMRRALARGFWRPEHIELTRPYLGRYFEAARELLTRNSPTLALGFARGAFPRTLIEPATIAAIDDALADDGLDPQYRRILIEARDDIQRALRTRAVDRG